MALLTRFQTLLGIALLGLAVAAPLTSCSEADSLGDEPPDEVQVGSPPQWDNGIGALMALKCAVCHQVPHTDVAPDDVPATFDLRYHVTSPSGLPGGQSITATIAAGILRGPASGVRQMPLPYATPLTTRERDALELWATNGGP